MKTKTSQLYNRLWMRWKRGKGPHPLAVMEMNQPKGIRAKPEPPASDNRSGKHKDWDPYQPFLSADAVCHSCAYIFALDGPKTCPRCNTPFDPEKQPVARKRENTAYMERWTPEQVKAIGRRRRWGEYSKSDFLDVERKLTAYLKRKRPAKAR